RVVVLKNERNSGSCAAMNTGLAQKKGGFVAILDADDYYLPGKLARQMAYLDAHAETGAVFCMPTIVDEQGNPSTYERVEKGLFRGKGGRIPWIAYLFSDGGFLLSASVLMRAEVLEKTGPFDPRFFRQPDIEFHVRLVVGAELAIMEDKL